MSGKLRERDHVLDSFAYTALRSGRGKVQYKFIKCLVSVFQPVRDLSATRGVYGFKGCSIQAIDGAHEQQAQIFAHYRYLGSGQRIDTNDQIVYYLNVRCQAGADCFSDFLASCFNRLEILLFLRWGYFQMRTLSLSSHVAIEFLGLIVLGQHRLKIDNQSCHISLQTTYAGSGSGNRKQRIRLFFGYPILFSTRLVCTLCCVDRHRAVMGSIRLICADEVASTDCSNRPDSLNPVCELSGCAWAKFDLDKRRQESCCAVEREEENNCRDDDCDNNEGLAREHFHGVLVGFRDFG